MVYVVSHLHILPCVSSGVRRLTVSVVPNRIACEGDGVKCLKIVLNEKHDH
jgi:hypothetical protein